MLLTYRYALLAVIVVAVIATIAGCGNQPVATVDGVKITETELNERLVQAFGEQVLRSMIDRELLRKAAEERGIELSEEDVAQEIEQAKAQYGDAETFQQFLATNNLSQEQWEDEVRIMALAKKLALHGVDPTEEQLRAFFEENRERFQQPAMVSLSEIVVSSEEEAQEVVSELEGGDASFADMVSRYSLTSSRSASGELPPMPIEQINQPEVKEVAANLPVGEISEPIESGGNWRILKVRDRTEGRPASFETDRERIEEQYKMRNANSLEDILDEQLNNTNVNIVDPRFQNLNADYSGVPDEVPQFGTEGGQAPSGQGQGQPAPQPNPDAPVLPDAPPAPDSE